MVSLTPKPVSPPAPVSPAPRLRVPEQPRTADRVSASEPAVLPSPTRAPRLHREVPPPSALPFIVGREATLILGDLVITVYQDARAQGSRRIIDYTVRLTDGAARPITDAVILLRGRSRDGALVEAPIDRSSTEGMYEAALMVPRSGLVDLALRIVRANRVVEVPVAVSGLDAAVSR